MKKSPLLLAFLLFSASLYPQFNIGIKSGYSLGNLSDNTSNIYSNNYKTIGGFDIGLTGEYQVSDLFSLQVEFLWVKRGGKRQGLQPIPNSFLIPQIQSIGFNLATFNEIIAFSGGTTLSDTTPLYASITNESHLNYIQVPLSLKYNFRTSSLWNFYIEGGSFVSFLTNARQRVRGTSKFFVDAQGNLPLKIQNSQGGILGTEFPALSFNETIKVKEQFNDFNVGLLGGVGVRRQIGKRYEVLFGSRITYGLLSVQKNSTLGSSKIGVFIFFTRISYLL